MEKKRAEWNSRHKQLRSLLEEGSNHRKGIDLFVLQHAEVHARDMSSAGEHSFQDDVLDGLAGDQVRRVPDGMEHSIAWTLWHLARIEDVTMNVLVAGEDQVLNCEGWREKLGVSFVHTGNMMSLDEIQELSEGLDLDQLTNYRLAVGRETEAMAKRLGPGDLDMKTPPSRLARLSEEGAVIEEAKGLLEYWGKRTVAELLLMPPTRHCFVHLNEALKIKAKVT
jgi:hypothetical protein